MGKAKGTEKTAAKQRSQIGIGWLVTALLIASAVTLGLKAWDDHQTNTEAALINTQLTALAGKEYIDGKAEKILSLLKNSSPAAYTTFTAEYAEIDIITPLSTARDAPPNSRLRTAAERIMLDKDKGGFLFTTPSGDIVILANVNGKEVLSLGGADAWLPKANKDYRFTLTGPGNLSRGNETLSALSVGLDYGQPKILNYEAVSYTHLTLPTKA